MGGVHRIEAKMRDEEGTGPRECLGDTDTGRWAGPEVKKTLSSRELKPGLSRRACSSWRAWLSGVCLNECLTTGDYRKWEAPCGETNFSLRVWESQGVV